MNVRHAWESPTALYGDSSTTSAVFEIHDNICRPQASSAVNCFTCSAPDDPFDDVRSVCVPSPLAFLWLLPFLSPSPAWPSSSASRFGDHELSPNNQKKKTAREPTRPTRYNTRERTQTQDFLGVHNKNRSACLGCAPAPLPPFPRARREKQRKDARGRRRGERTRPPPPRFTPHRIQPCHPRPSRAQPLFPSSIGPDTSPAADKHARPQVRISWEGAGGQDTPASQKRPTMQTDPPSAPRFRRDLGGRAVRSVCLRVYPIPCHWHSARPEHDPGQRRTTALMPSVKGSRGVVYMSLSFSRPLSSVLPPPPLGRSSVRRATVAVVAGAISHSPDVHPDAIMLITQGLTSSPSQIPPLPLPRLPFRHPIAVSGHHACQHVRRIQHGMQHSCLDRSLPSLHHHPRTSPLTEITPHDEPLPPRHPPPPPRALDFIWSSCSLAARSLPPPLLLPLPSASSAPRASPRRREGPPSHKENEAGGSWERGQRGWRRRKGGGHSEDRKRRNKTRIVVRDSSCPWVDVSQMEKAR